VGGKSVEIGGQWRNAAKRDPNTAGTGRDAQAGKVRRHPSTVRVPQLAVPLAIGNLKPLPMSAAHRIFAVPSSTCTRNNQGCVGLRLQYAFETKI